MFLTDDDLRDLTGFSRPSKQIEWLRREGFEHRVGADGHPRVLKAHVMSLMGAVDNAQIMRKSAPDFSSLKKVA